MIPWNWFEVIHDMLQRIDVSVRQLKTSTIIEKLNSIDSKLDIIIEVLVPTPASGIIFTAIFDDGTRKEGVTKVDLRDDQKVQLTIAITDKKGKPAAVDGVPAWASSDETVITVTPAADGMGAQVDAVAPGQGRVVVTADADLGSGVTPITGTLDFNVTAGGAINIAITAGTPEDQ